MRGIPIFAGLALASAAPLAADVSVSQEQAVIAGANAFMDAIANSDRSALAEHIIPEAVIFVHNETDPAKPRVDIIPVTKHLENWGKRSADYEESMRYDHVLVSGDMAQVWGPYSFTWNGKLTHCGVNSLSMVKMDDGSWKVGNVSFTMVAPDRCAAVGVNWLPAE
ncbi:hypothetical protein AMC99_00376 [Altererythrobacter epoxidivorans]|uniref:Uncharacterized protein n=1 Tax=Altererythrobacter epoxidivorans TaxID=361183 RepID=A0A0M4MTY4_9SPHN|nr:DUF4440 domain-containing protein [Altererythrobacter epoxidivorans]ALE15688.1 hypothetical protein AMC99_00376 [Altererythrobacter epoxidivorans]